MSLAAVKGALGALPTQPKSFIAELRVPGYDAPPAYPRQRAGFERAVDGVLATLTPKLEGLIGQGLITRYEFDPLLKADALGTIDTQAAQAPAARNALLGLGEIKALYNNGRVGPFGAPA